MRLYSGREFGTLSLEIHVKSCAKKWETEQSMKPPNERKMLPQPPQELDNLLPSDISTYNEKA